MFQVSSDPRDLKGEGSMVNPVVGVICRLSGALPKRAYLVLETLVERPDSFSKVVKYVEDVG